MIHIFFLLKRHKKILYNYILQYLVAYGNLNKNSFIIITSLVIIFIFYV